MRCAEAQEQINQFSIKTAKADLDQAVQDHIDHCVDCAALWKAQITFTQDMTVLSEQVQSDKLDFDRVKANALSRQRQREDMKMRTDNKSWLSSLIKSRPRLSISLATVTILILITVLSPFKFSDPAGFEIAIAGVDRELIDSGEIEKALKEAGLEYAKVEFANCAPECILTVSNLISEEDVKTAKETIGHLKQVHYRKPLETYVDKKSGAEVTTGTQTETENIGDGVWEKEINYNNETTQKISIDLKLLKQDTTILWTEWYHHDGDSSEGLSHEIIVQPGGSYSESMIFLPSLKWFRARDTWYYDSTGKSLSHIITDTLGNEHEINLHDWSKQEQQYNEVGMYYRMVYRDDGTPALAGMNTDPSFDIPNLAEGMYLNQNNPNPFDTTTEITFGIPNKAHVKVTIYKYGKLIRTLVDEELKAGEHKIKWDCRDKEGNRSWAWRYICKIEIGEYYHAISMAQIWEHLNKK